MALSEGSGIGVTRAERAGRDGLLMVLDAGGGGGRCLLIDTAGRQVAFAYRPWTMRAPDYNPMGSVFDPEEWWSALAAATREALAEAVAAGRGGAEGPEVLAMSTTSIRDGSVWLDAQGDEVYCGTNRDGSAVGLGFEIAQNLGELHWRITGRWPLGLDPAARLLWHKRERPDVFERVRHVMMVSDWVRYRLSGEIAVEPTNASSSGLFDIEKGTWSRELAEAHQFDPAILLEVRWPGQPAGVLSGQAARDLRLPEGIPVVTGLADTQAGCLGSGGWDAGDTVIVAGTTAPVMQVLDECGRDETRKTFLGSYAVPGKWAREGIAGLTGTAYAWYADAFVKEPDPYGVLDREVAAAPAAEVMAWLGPAVSDFSALKFPADSVIKFPPLGVFCTPDRGMMARAVLENIAYSLKGILEQLPSKPDKVTVCGGQSRSAAFVSILASVLGLPVAVPEVREATAMGAAAAAAVGAGVYGSLEEATLRMVRIALTVEPDPAAAGQYAATYRKWLAGPG